MSNQAPAGRRGRTVQDGVMLCGPVFIEKNQREQLRLSIDEYHGHRLLSARVWYRPEGTEELRPGVGGWAINIARLPEIAAALEALAVDADAKGLLA
jgi:hypothetical protein